MSQPVDRVDGLGRLARYGRSTNRLLKYGRPTEEEVPEEEPRRRRGLFARVGEMLGEQAVEAGERGLAAEELRKEAIRMGARGLGEAGLATAEGTMSLVGARGAAEDIDRWKQEAEEFYGEPETPVGQVAHMGGRMAGEAALFAVPATGVTKAGRVAAAAGRTGRIARMAAPATRAGRRLQNIAIGAPLDIAISQAGPEESMVGGLAELTGAPILRAIAEDPVLRGLGEATLGAVGSTALMEGAEAVARRSTRFQTTTEALERARKHTINEIVEGIPPARRGRQVIPEEPLPETFSRMRKYGELPETEHPVPHPARREQVPETARPIERDIVERDMRRDWQKRIDEARRMEEAGELEPGTATRMEAERERTTRPPETIETEHAPRGATGSPDIVKNADGSEVRVEWEVVEARDIVTSHDPDTFTPRSEYPRGVQERRYHADQSAQARVLENESMLDPDIVLDPTIRPTEGPPIVDFRNNAISGNQRSMALARAASANSDRYNIYRERLIERAGQYGVDPEQIAGMERPVLVRRIVDPEYNLNSPDTLRELAAKFNEVSTKAKDPLGDAATRAFRMREAETSFNHFTDTIHPDQTMREYMGTPSGRRFLDLLVADGVITKPESARFIGNMGELTEEGKGVIERMLHLSAIGDPDVVERAPRIIMQKMEHAIPTIVRASAVPGWELEGLLQEALNLSAAARASGSRSIDEFIAQGDVFGRAWSRKAADMARFLEESNKLQVSTSFREYSQDAQRAAGYIDTEDLFGHEPIGPEEAFTRSFTQEVRSRQAGLSVTPGSQEIASLATDALPDVRLPVSGELPTAPRRQELVRELAEALDIPVRTGRIRGRKSIQGIYKINPEVIRTRVANDIEAVSHEVGHHLHKLLFGTTPGGRLKASALRVWRHELEPIAEELGYGGVTEGFAEFVRRYLTNPEAARRVAPDLYKWFDTELPVLHKDVHEILLHARENYNVWLEAGEQARVRSQRSTQHDPRHFSIPDAWNRFRTNVIDDMDPIERAVRDMTSGADPLRIEEDAAKLARLTRGSAGTAEHFLEHGTLDFNTLQPNGRPLREILKPVKDDLENFIDYGISRRALELHTRGIESGIRPEDARVVVEKLGSPVYEEVFDGIQEYNRHLLEYIRDAGVVSDESLQRILELNQEYLPFYRVMEDQPARGRGGSRFGHLFSPVKRIKGSGREIIDPIEGIIKNTYMYTQLAARQQVSNALGELATRHGVGRWLEEIPPPVRPTKFTAEDLPDWMQMAIIHGEEARLIRSGVSAKEAERMVRESPIFEDLHMIWRPGDYFGKPNVISVLQEGKRKWYEVDPELYAALEGLTKDESGALIRVLSFPSRTLRAGATLAPEFMVRNPMRDAMQAFVQSEYGFIPGVDTARGLFHLLKKDDLYWSWKAAGGEWASLVDLDRRGMRAKIDEIIKGRRGLRNAVRSPLETLRVLSSLMENTTRMGEFARAMAREGTSKTGLQTAAAAAREVSIDFARHGSNPTIRAVRQIAAFWNARLQGYDRLLRAMKTNPVRTFGKIGVGITLPSILLYYANRDDPEYLEIPQWQRDLFWLVKVRGTWVRIPKPFELGIVFGSIPERILEWIDSNDPEGLSEIFHDTLARELTETVIPIPTAVQPFIENWANWSMFLERPIVSRSQEGVAPQYQYTDRTSEVAKGFGRMLEISPAKIDNLLYSWTGGLGRIATSGIDEIVAGISTPETGERPRGTLADIPGVRGFIAREPGRSSESIERFYREYEKATTAYNTASYLRRQGMWEELEKWQARYDEQIDNYRNLRSTADQLAGIRAEISMIERDPDLSAELKRKEIEVLGLEMMQIAAEMLDDLGVEVPTQTTSYAPEEIWEEGELVGAGRLSKYGRR